MNSVVAFDTLSAAFVAGLVTSLHCAGMCGPLACSWAVTRSSPSAFLRNTALYHGARLTAYTLVGALAGAVGTLPKEWLEHRWISVFPWTLVLGFLLIGLGADRWLPKPAFLTLPMARLRLRAMAFGGAARALIIGIATPLLPCGPLYVMFAMALANGSAAKGAEFSLSFGLGTLPLLVLVQTQLHRLGIRLSPAVMKRCQQGLALAAAVVLAWRLRGTLTGEEASCCHTLAHG
jgi:sulfite exporter TauE/SafE